MRRIQALTLLLCSIASNSRAAPPIFLPHQVPIQQAAKKYNLSPELLTRIMLVESRGRIEAVSPTGDLGLMQVSPATLRAYNMDARAIQTSSQYSIDAGARVLKDLQRHYSAREPTTWPCRYNIGGQKLPRACANYLNKLKNIELPRPLDLSTEVAPHPLAPLDWRIIRPR